MDIQFSALTTPLSRVRLRSKGNGKLSIHHAADLETIETVLFQTSSVFTEQSLRCVKNHETLHERTGRPVVMGQSSFSLVLSVIKTEVSLDCDDPVNQDLLLQQYGES